MAKEVHITEHLLALMAKDKNLCAECSYMGNLASKLLKSKEKGCCNGNKSPKGTRTILKDGKTGLLSLGQSSLGVIKSYLNTEALIIVLHTGNGTKIHRI